jgi:hypothetical protein
MFIDPVTPIEEPAPGEAMPAIEIGD